MGVDAGSPSGLQKPPRSFGAVASRKRSDFTDLPDGVFGFSCHRSEALSDRVLLFKCPFEVGARKVTTLAVTAGLVQWQADGRKLSLVLKLSYFFCWSVGIFKSKEECKAFRSSAWALLVCPLARAWDDVVL